MRELLIREICVAVIWLFSFTAMGQTVVGPGEVLSVTSSTAENFLLNGGTLAPAAVTLSGSISLQANSVILRMQNPFVDGRGGPREIGLGPTILSGVISGRRSLEYRNESTRDFISIESVNTYTGHTYITSGEVFVATASALGSTVAGTTIQGGELTILAPTDEQFRIEGGSLTFNADDFIPSDPITVAGGEVFLPQLDDYGVPVIVDGSGGAFRFGNDDSSSWTGGSTGTGSLRLNGRVQVDAPLTHDGDLIIDGVTLNAVNTFTGKTTIANNYVIDRADVFGTSTTPIEITDGSTLVNVLPNGDRGFSVIGGVLDIRLSNTPINGPMLVGGSFSATVTGNGVFNGPIELEGDEITRAFLRGGTFNGVISGSARELTIGGNNPVVLNADNDYRAITLSGGDRPVELNAQRALGDPEQGTRVSFGQFNFNAATNEPVVVTGRGLVQLNAQQGRFPRFSDLDTGELDRRHTVEVNVPSKYDEGVDVAEGTLQINANLSLGNLAVIKNGAVRTAEGKTLDIGSGELMFQEGLIDGRIHGSGTLRKTTTARGEIQHLPGFDGDIVVERGILEVFSMDALGSMTGATYVAEKDAVLILRDSQFDPPLVIEEEIFLNNSTGIDHTGGLLSVHLCCSSSGSIIRLEGRLDLGTEKSIIGGDGTIELTGPITGGGVTTHGEDLRIRILNGSNSYSGPTNVRQSRIELSENGRLASTSKIILNEGPESHKGTLLLDNSVQALSDRVADTIPIEFRGGELAATGGTLESLGQMNFIEGSSDVDMDASFNANESIRQLHVMALNRQPGATARFELASNAQFRIAEAPVMVGGIFPWMVVQDRSASGDRNEGLGTLDDGGIAPLTSYQPDINAATSDDHVRLQSATVVLSESKVVGSLTFPSSQLLDLGGNRLSVNTGAVFNGRLENGKITAGEANNYELIFLQGGQIETDIVDNGGHPVSVTTTGGSTFSGNNSYSGTTYVNENELNLVTETALPDNTDLQIVGGEVRIGYIATVAKHLGQVRITGDGALTQSFTGQRGQGMFSFDRIVLEDGELVPGQLVGSGDIIKRTIGPASIRADQRSTYNGNVIIEEGRLSSSGLPQAKYTVRGGSLDLSGGNNAITLDGGTLYLSSSLSGNIDVLSASTISTESSATTRFRTGYAGQLSGPGSLNLTGEVRFSKIRHEVRFSNNSPNYTGDVTIDSVLVDAEQQQSLGTGSITILPGGKLRFGGRDISSELPSFDLANEIHLRGGDLFGRDSDRQPRQLLGNLRVSDHSLIGEMNVLGTTYLEDGARLTTFREGVLRFFGDIKIGGKTELEYGLQQIVTNSAGTNGGVVQLLGTISSDAEEAVLNFLDRGLDEVVLDASYHVATGQTLQILKDGLPIELKVDGSDNTITGGGTLLNPVEFGDGATISPGSSPGVLSLGSSTTLGADSVYEWEINDVLGAAGQSVGWDLLQVTDELIFDATEQNPFILKVIGLDETGEEGIVDNFDPSQNYEWLIASANSITGFDPTIVQIDTSRFTNNNPLPDQNLLSLRFDGGNLFLVHQVPEPTSWVLLSLGLMSIASRWRN